MVSDRRREKTDEVPDEVVSDDCFDGEQRSPCAWRVV